MNGTFRGAALAATCVLLAGCSETGFQDLFGAGKYSPDETLVHQNQSLSMPPDLQLRPPSNESVPAQQQAYVPPPQPMNQPPAYQEPATAAPQQPYTPPPQPIAQQPVNQPPQDVYARMGISKTRPDGTPKTQAELTEEMRQKKLADEKTKNPNYGTIWNMGNVFSD